MRRTTGFTLVEILIVVIILGILAAIVIPQFTKATDEAREAALASDIQTMRNQIELYKVQHLERYPDIDKDGLADVVVANFKDRMLNKTKDTGELDANGNYGPYLQDFPKNPYVADGLKDGLTIAAAVVPGDDTTGWYWDTTNDKFSPNDANHKDW